ncbi:MAG TPA: hypothetical protein VKC63_11080 [Solirubrobacterales bacterium]|nr:hypothetical protein [Solirubrobacterales bacterium]
MIATYAAVLAVCAASLALGQAAIALCGVRRWSWLSPAVGLALVCAICWATVRMPGHGVVSAIVILVLAVAAAIHLRGRLEGGGEALRVGLPVALGALLAASLPFAVEGHFGILGTGFNPDMSQHLLATDRLAQGAGSQLLHQGYPLGPHSVVVALDKGLGIGVVQGFSGLTIAAAILAPLTALAAFIDQPPLRRTPAALLVGLPYLVASYFAQGAFKEVIQALFVLGLVLALRESSRTWRSLPLRFVPAAIIAIGSVYTYSFPGLIWLVAILLIWLALERSLPLRPLLLALLAFAVGTLPELGRMIDFHSFETFDPNGPGLGNLFGQVSPFTALGIWFSGDFRLAPGNGAVPAFAYFTGAAFAALLLVCGLIVCWRRRETTILAGIVGVVLLYAAARVGGTPYTSAKALEVAAPLAALAIVLPLVRRPVTLLYLLVGGICSLLAFANAPVGPTSYSPALTGLRQLLAGGSTLVLAPGSLLADEQGSRYIAWELRGARVCIEPESAAGGRPPSGIRFFVTSSSPSRRPFAGLTLRRRAGSYTVWERHGVIGGPSPCPLIAVRQARQGP